MNAVNRVSASAALLRRAPVRVLPFVVPIAAEFTLAQRVARYGLTAVAIVAMSALFGIQIAATLH